LGRDSFFYIAIRNHSNTFEFIIDTLKEKNDSALEKLVKNNVDIFGKSFVHYIVSPLDYGSFENSDLLQQALDLEFDYSIQDRDGLTPYDYACR
jgi:ankyrin repeat protein